MGNKGTVSVKVTEIGNTETLLSKVELAFREIALTQGLLKTGDVVVRRAKVIVRKGGSRIGRKTGKKHLKDTITKVVRDYGERKVLLVGPAYPAGAHGHLLEHGHDIVKDGKVVGRAPPYPFLRPAADQTKTEQLVAFESVLKKQAEQPGIK